MEMADTILINKADGDNSEKANLAVQDYKNALHLFPANENGWIPKVETCSALNNQNIDFISNTIDDFITQTSSNGSFSQNRKIQAKYWLDETINTSIKTLFYNNPTIKKAFKEIENNVVIGKISPFVAARKLIELFKN